MGAVAGLLARPLESAALDRSQLAPNATAGRPVLPIPERLEGAAFNLRMRAGERAEPNSAQALTKLSQSLLCRFNARKHDVHIPTLRLYSVYGPYEEPTRFVPHGLDRRLPPLASPDVARDFVYTNDVAEAFVLAAERTDTERGGIDNVGTGTQTKLRDAVRLARETFDIAAEPAQETMPDRAWDTATWVANVHKIEREFGWKASIPFDDGFHRFSAWINEGRERYRA